MAVLHQDITLLPEVVANMLGVSEEFGGVFVTTVLLMTVIGSFTVFNRKALTPNMFLVLTFLVLSLSTLAGWITYWWLIILIAILAIFGSIKIKDKAG